MTSYPAVARSLPVLRADLRAFAHRLGLNGPVTAAMCQAASEAAANAIVHGHGGGDDAAKIEVRTSSGPGEVTVTVLDRGAGFRPRRNTPGLGLGLGVIAQLADDLELEERDGGGVCVSMLFRV